MRKRGKIYEISQFAIIFFWIIFTASAADAELRIESVTPDQGVAGQELAVMITGTGFDENTRVSVYMDRVLGNVETPDYYANGIALSGNFAFVTDYESLQVVDVNDPQNPAIIGSLDTGGYVHGVALSGDLVFVTNGGSGLQVVDVSDPHNPTIIGYVDTTSSAYDVALSGNLAFVTDDSGLQVVDVSDPQNLAIIGSVDTPGYAQSVALSGDFAFVADYDSLQVVDVSDPHNPAIIASVDIWGDAESVALSGNLAFVADEWGDFEVVDVSDPHNPIIIAYSDTLDDTALLALSGSLAFVGDTWEGLQVVDVSDLQNPTVIGSVAPLDGYNDYNDYYEYYCAALSENIAFVMDNDSNFYTWPLPTEVSSVTVSSETTLSVTLPAPDYAGRYTLRVFNGTETSEFPGSLMFVPGWTPISARHSMKIRGNGYFNGIKIISGGYTIAAFGPGGDSDCRGKADITETDWNWKYDLTVVSDTDGEDISFRIWNPNEGRVYSVKEKIIFKTDAEITESLDMPLKIESVFPDRGVTGQELPVMITGSGFDESTKVSMNNQEITPAIVTGETSLSLTIPAFGTAGRHTLKVYNETESFELPGAVILAPDWTPVSAQHSMRVRGQGFFNGWKIRTSGYTIAAFGPDGECRGKADIIKSGARWEYDLIVVSDTDGEEISFKIWNNNDGLLQNIQETVIFETDAEIMKSVDASLSLESVTPDQGVAGQELSVAVTGTGFDENTRVSMYMESILGSVDTPSSAYDVTLSGNLAFVADRDSGLQVVDVSDPQNPFIIGSVDTSDALSVALSGNLAFVADGYGGLQVADVSDPHHPTIIASMATPGAASDVALSGNLAFIADWDSGLQVVDVSDPHNPAIIASVNTSGYGNEIALSGNLAFVADVDRGLQVVDVSDPLNPTIIGSVNTPGYAVGVALSGNLAFIATGGYGGGLQVVDVSDPHHPVIIGSVDTPGYAQSVALSGDLAFVADYDKGLQVVDVSNPQNPAIITSVDTPRDALSVALSGNLAFVAGGYAGLLTWPVPVEIPSVTLTDETHLSVTIPGTVGEGIHTLRVFDETEHSELSGAVTLMPGWNPVSAQYSMTLRGQGYFDGEKIESDGYVIAAFGPGGESDCRGKAEITEKDGNWEYQLAIASETDGEEITFRIRNNNDLSLYMVKDTVVFETDSDMRKSLDMPPKIESVTPDQGVAGQELSVIITGTGFDENTRVSVYFQESGEESEITSVTLTDETHLSVTIPDITGAGMHKLKVCDDTENCELSGAVTLVPDWKPISALHSMTVEGHGYFNGTKITSDGYTIAAFGPGGESDCRGKADITETDGIWKYDLTVVSDTDGEEISFRIWNLNDGRICDVEERIIFEADTEITESLDMPLEIESVFPDRGVTGQELPVMITGTGFDENTRVSICHQEDGDKTEITPVIATDETSISLTIPALETAGRHTMKVYDDTESSELPGAVTLDPVWTPISAQHSMRVRGQGFFDGEKIESSGYTIAAFGPGGECRGKADISESGGIWEYDLTVVSDTNGETLFFQIWNKNDSLLQNVQETLIFEADAEIMKSFDAPLTLESVSPVQAVAGQNTEVTLSGIGFDENTRVRIYQESSVTSIEVPGHNDYYSVVGVTVSDNTVFVSSGYKFEVIGDTAFLCGAEYDERLNVIDVADPEHPVVVGSVEISDYDLLVAASGNTALIGRGGLQVVDVENPESPVIIGAIDTRYAYSIEMSGNTAFVATGDGLQVIDLADPENPTVISSVDIPVGINSYGYGVTVSGNTAFVAGDEKFYVIDVADPESPVIIGSVDTPNYNKGVAVSGDTAFLLYWGGLSFISIADPGNPLFIGSVDIPGYESFGIKAFGDTAFVGVGNGLMTVPKPEAVSSLTVNGEREISLTFPGSAAPGRYTLMAFNGTEAHQLPGAVTLSPDWNPKSGEHTMELHGGVWIDGSQTETDGYMIAAFGTGGESDCRGKAELGSGEYRLTVASDNDGEDIRFRIWDSNEGRVHTIKEKIAFRSDTSSYRNLDEPLKAVSVSSGQNNEVTLIGTGFDEKTRVYTYPESSRHVASYDANDVAISGNTAFVADWNGLQVIDVTDLETLGYVDISYAEGVAVSGNTAFIVGGYDLQVIDVTNPESPVITGYADMGFTTKGVAVSGNTAFVAAGYESLKVIDVTDEQNPVIVGAVDIPDFDMSGNARRVAVSGDIAFIVGNDEYGDDYCDDYCYGWLQVVDVSDPENPAIIGSLGSPRTGFHVIDMTESEHPAVIGSLNPLENPTGVTLSSSFAFVTDTRGLKIIDAANPEKPVFIGSVETPGHAEGVAVSGNIAFVADGDEGLQVIDVTDPETPVIVGSVTTPGYANGVTVSGDAVYAACDDGLFTMPLPKEIARLTVRSDTEISLSFPPQAQSGVYTIMVSNGKESHQLKYPVFFDDPSCVKGDLSGDGEMSPADAILALQTVAGSDILPACAVPFIDVNGDGKIGIAEAIYILRDAAGMR